MELVENVKFDDVFVLHIWDGGRPIGKKCSFGGIDMTDTN